MATHLLNTDALRRICVALIVAEQQKLLRKGAISRDRAAQLLQPRLDEAEIDNMTVNEASLGFDSLSVLSLVLDLNRLFHLHKTGVEDYLLVHRTIGDWVEILNRHLELSEDDLSISFRTSGTTGEPKEVSHTGVTLRQEVAVLHKELLPNFDGRVISMVPPHHIYGFLWTCILPTQCGCGVLDLHRAAPTAPLRNAQPGDLVIGTPHNWQAVNKTGLHFADGVIGVTSGGPSCAQTWGVRKTNRLSRMIEVYGATETGGIGFRTDGDAAFRLLPHLSRAGEQFRGEQGPVNAQDKISWVSPTEFYVMGRNDAVVQVGGVNVSLDVVRDAIIKHGEIADATVRLDKGRLKAFVEPDSGHDARDLTDRLRTHLQQTLPAVAVPHALRVGKHLPRNEMGKLCDWDIEV